MVCVMVPPLWAPPADQLSSATQTLSVRWRLPKSTGSIASAGPEEPLAYRHVAATGKPLIANNAVNNGQVIVPTIFLDVHVVTAENMRETVVKDGFHTEAEVFRGTKE